LTAYWGDFDDADIGGSVREFLHRLNIDGGRKTMRERHTRSATAYGGDRRKYGADGAKIHEVQTAVMNEELIVAGLLIVATAKVIPAPCGWFWSDGSPSSDYVCPKVARLLKLGTIGR